MDDAYLVGRIAAVNATSDLWVKGVHRASPSPRCRSPEPTPTARRNALSRPSPAPAPCSTPSGITLLGGHTTNGHELVVGFTMFGIARAPPALLRIGGLAPGDRLVLTKPVGTGVLFFADVRGLARGEWVQAALASMARTNAAASRVARSSGRHRGTDVTGFGLAGHLGQMLRASKASALIGPLRAAAPARRRGAARARYPQHLPPGRTRAARRALRIGAGGGRAPAIDALFDPQTSGGLLFGVPADAGRGGRGRVRAGGDVNAALIGEVTPPHPDGALFEVVR